MENEFSVETSAILCCNCGVEILLSQRYCGKCGTQAWDPCLACDEKNPVGTRYCEYCGDDQEASVKTCRGELQGLLARADEKAATGRFLDALAMLNKQELVEHSRLAEPVSQIRNRLEKFPQQREKAIAESRQAIEEVQGLLERHQYSLVWQRLVAIPPAFRSDRLNELLDEARCRIRETEKLSEEIKAMLRARDGQGLLPKVRRLAELKPDDKKIQELLQQLVERKNREDRKRACQQIMRAKTALAKYDYKQAEQVLATVSAGIEDPTIVKALLEVKECVWMADMLRTAPHIRPLLVVIAKRLLQLQPGDPQLVELARRLGQNLTKSQREKNSRPILWVNGPEKTRLGVPVDLLPHPQVRMGGSGKVAGNGDIHAVAFGLALQALGRVEYAIQLDSPEKKSSWLKRLLPRGLRQGAGMAWGIEIGSRGLKAILLGIETSTAGGDGTDDVKLLQSVFMPHRLPHVEDPKSDKSPSSTASETVDRFIEQFNPTGRELAINIPGTQTLGRFFELPPSKPDRFHEAVRYEARARIPLEEQEMYHGHSWSEADAPDHAGKPMRRVVLVAASRKTVVERLGMFSSSGLEPRIIQSDCLALANLARYLEQAKQVNFPATGAVAIVEIGTSTTNVVILSGSQVWFRGIYGGASDWDQAISREFKKTRREAEALRKHPEKYSHMHKVHACLLPEFEEFSKTIHKMFDQYRRETGSPIFQLFLCGGGSRQFGLLRYLRFGR